MTQPPAEQPLPRRFARLAVPNILSNLTVPLVGLVDTGMLGHLEDIRFLGGVALGSVLFDYAYWTFGFLRMGTTGTTAQALGAGDREEVYQILYRTLLIAGAVAALLLAVRGPLGDLGFALLSGSPQVEAAGRAYFDARIWAAPATLANFVLIGWLLGREQSREALVMTAVGNGCNILLDWWFILRLGWSAFGAGAATALSQYVMLAVGVVLFLRQVDRRRFRRAAVLDRGRLAELLRLNRDILVRTLCLVSTFALFTNFSAVMGETLLAANAILLRLQSVASYLIDGAAFATESLAGIFRGRGDGERLRSLLRLAAGTGAAFALVFLAALLLAPGVVLGTLTSHADVVAAGRRFAPWLGPVLLFGALAYIYDGFFLGLTRGTVLRNSMLLSALVFFLPLAWLAVSRQDNHLLWGAMALFMVGRAATLGWASRRELAA